MRAAYDGIYFDLKRSIIEGVYQYKDFLPSESALIKQYGCAHNTVRKAIAILAGEGFVQPIHGKGVRVIYHSTPLLTDQQPILAPYGIESFSTTLERLGCAHGTKVLSMENIAASSDFAKLTGFAEGERLVRLERVRYYDGRPLEREVNHFRADLVEGMTKADAEHSVYHYIETECDGKIVTCKRVVTIGRATEEDKAVIDLGDTDFVAAVDVATYDGDGLVCEITQAHYHPDIFTMLQVTTRSRVNHTRGEQARQRRAS